jgi:hypothetical protein
MRKKLIVVVASGIFAIGMILATLLPASSATTINVYEKENQGFQKFINVDGTKSSAGDYSLFSSPLFQAGTGKKVGRDTVEITVIHSLGKHDARFRAAATFRIGNGKIEVAGSGRFSGLVKGTASLAIIGGTGAYNGASGTLVIRQMKYRNHLTFNIRS